VTVTSVASLLVGAGCINAEAEAALLVEAADTAERLEEMVARRTAGEPLEYVVGWTEFRGIRVVVRSGVFVPRARSGFLVEEAASLMRCVSGGRDGAVLVDLCCGIGALGVAVAAEVPSVELHAVDIDARAVSCAEENHGDLGGGVYGGDLFAALPRRLRRRVDVIMASPPYVPTEQMALLPAEARCFEPVIALDGGEDGFAIVRRIARGARQWLAPHGFLALEVGEVQAEPVGPILEGMGYSTRVAVSAEFGSAVVIGRRPH
jgi:release factor glutamine methyltransferase